MTVEDFEELFAVFVRKYAEGEINLTPRRAMHDFIAGIHFYERMASGYIDDSREMNYFVRAVWGRNARERKNKKYA